MEGEEEEASNVNKPPFQVQHGSSVMADATDDVRDAVPQCDSEPKSESAEDRLGVGGESPQRPDSGINHGDVIEGEEGKEANEEGERKDVAEMLEEEEEEEEEKVAAEVAEESAADVEEEIAVADAEGTPAAVDVAVAEEEAVLGASEEVETTDMADKELERKMADAAPLAEEDLVVAHSVQRTGMVSEEGDKAYVAEKADEADVEDDTGVAKEEGMDDVAEEAAIANVSDEIDVKEDEGMAEPAEETNFGGQVEELEMGDTAETEDATLKGEEAQEEVERDYVEAEGEGEGDEREDARTEEEDVGVSGMADETMETEAEAGEEPDVADVMEETTEAEETEAVEGAEAMEAVEEARRGGKRKRGKNLKAPVKVSSRKKMEEDVCFICFDGGELVLCDRRGCPKAYHPSCVNRDEAFFRAKGRWNCGWHLCSTCGKNAHYMCYTCTFSLCKGCIRDATILCVRGNKGFCETCMRTVMMIEKNEGNMTADNVDFDDKSSWEYLFKDYWTDLKGKLSLTLDELAEAKNPWKGSDPNVYKHESADEPFDMNNDVASDTDGSSGNVELSHAKRRKTRKRLKSRTRDRDSSTLKATSFEGLSVDDGNAWASKELLEFVMHMRNGDTSVISQFDVQALLLEYIKRNKLRDPRKKSQIICDSRLENLFGKPRVGHFEMLKLLESHFLIKEDSHADDLQGSVVDMEASQLEADVNSDAMGRAGKDKKRKTRRKADGKGPQSNLDDYAAIDNHNINLIYLRRNLVEDLLDDTEKFHEKVVGSFVRIRISGSNQKQDLYRLVQVVGTCKAGEPYKVGKRMTDIFLEILNLNKQEIVSIDIISNQEFTEDECKRLRQSIKCGLINRLTVGDVQEKAMALQAVRVKDWLESEIVRLSHLRDRASEKGRRKELRECVEKIQLLKTPEERHRRLEDIPEIHADPNMDPSFESEEEEETDDKRQENYIRARGSGFGRRGREPISPRKSGSALNDSWSGARNYSSMNQESSRNMSSRGFSNKLEDMTGASEIVNESWNQGRDREIQQPNSWEKHKMSNLETGSRSMQSVVVSESFPAVVSGNSATPFSTGAAESASKINEAEKIWHYQDPSGKVQGPFSIVQLRKWSATGYFPANLRIWKATEKQDDSILLTDALAGRFQKDKIQVVHNLNPSPTHSGRPQVAPSQRAAEVQVGGESWRSQKEINPSAGKLAPLPVEVPKYSSDAWGSTNLPSPTPSQTPLGAAKAQTYESKWSGNPALSTGSGLGVNQFSENTGGTQGSMARVAEHDSSSSVPGMTPALKTEKMSSTNELPTHHLPTISTPLLNHASVNTGADITNVVSNLQSLVQSVASHIPSVETKGWGSVSVPKPEMVALGPMPGSESQPWRGAPSQKVEPNNPVMMHTQPPAHGHWSDASTIHSSASSFGAGNAGGNFPSTGFPTVPPSDPWRPPVSSSQSNIQPPGPSNLPWGMGVVDNNQSAAPRLGQENQNPSWGPVPGNPNMGWGGPVPGNANLNWGGAPGQGLPPGNTSSGWVAAPNQGATHGNPVLSWVPSGQGAPPLSTNVNQGWVGHGQGPPAGNANPSWAASSGNPGNWGAERSHNADRFVNHRDMGSQSGDSGYGGAKPWNRQSSFGSGGGGGSSRPYKGQRVCKYHESGHCKKGASCDYLHT